MKNFPFIKRNHWIETVCLTVFFIAASCENDLEDIRKLENFEKIGVEIIKEVQILYSDSAIVRIRIEGPVMNRYTETGETREEFPEGVRVDFFNEKGDVTGWLTAKKGIRYDERGEIIVRDSVVWESIEQERLETEELIWEEKSQKVHTNKFVVIRRPDEIIYGYGFEANQDFTHSRIRAIEGRLKVEESDAFKN